MALFQNSVLNKYLNELDNSKIATLYTQYSEYFLNPDIQQNIRESKEEQFQEGFLRELFVKVLGYTINPNPNYNLTTELKNESGAKKADGAIMKGGKAIGVIELKSTTTKDLESIRQQAFDYKANHSECIYVVTSNFEKLRFYIDNAVDYEEFDLFTLTLSQFKLLYLCLNVDNILGGVPKSAKIASLVKEENVTKKLYADYSVFKEKLFKDIISTQDNLDLADTTDEKEAKLILFKKTQKLMDRFLFIFFSEDRGLIPPNTISTILTEWEKLKSLDAYRPLYDRFKRHFDYINEGWKGDNYEVFAYNGGLFLPDPILDNITIDDEVLYEHTKVLTKYDFESEVDVNILGHIFEHSLTEIETVSAELEGQEIDKKKTKRKKDGVFYTPKYITKYIVDNTVGKLCEEKKQELGIEEEDYLKGKKNRRKETIKKLEDMLMTYRDWLLGVTIVDPACGSGAFLNQALEFLIAEHRWIDEMTAKLFGGGLVFQDVENSILENNLYGVDINEESVEIAKLSLWLRTAQKGRKLTSLNNNIKCGNSLIDDPAVAGDKAFKWEEEFPKVFAKGGFDVVIGNPPYLRVQGLKENFKTETEYFENNYKTATGRFDIYILFLEKSFGLIKKSGAVSFIVPHKFIVSNYGSGIRKFLIQNQKIESLIHFGSNKVFGDASTYTCIIKLSYNNRKILYKQINPQMIFEMLLNETIEYKTLTSEIWNLTTDQIFQIQKKINSNLIKLKDITSNISRGVVTGADGIFIVQGRIYNNEFVGFSKELNEEIIIEKDLVKPILMGNSVTRYTKMTNELFLIYPHTNSQKTIPLEEEFLEKQYPKTYNYLLKFKSQLVNKKIKYKTNPKYWYGLHNSRQKELFESQKIVTPYLANRGEMSFDYSNNFYTNDKCTLLKISEPELIEYEYLLGLLNSKLMWFYISNTSSEYSGGYFAFTFNYLKDFPLPKVLSKPKELKRLVSLQTRISNEYLDTITSFLNLLQSKFDIDKLSRKLENWHELEFKQFLAELKKKKVKLSLNEEAEWMDYFNEKKAEAQELKSKIDAIDNELDHLVYKLYDLTYDEVLIVDPETPITREGY